jgi:hypothetical protein
MKKRRMKTMDENGKRKRAPILPEASVYERQLPVFGKETTGFMV